MRLNDKIVDRKFLSTPSARRATHTRILLAKAGSYFYPRPPRGGRPLAELQSIMLRAISIHALREEGDIPGLVDHH